MTIRTRRQRREMRAELADPQPMPRTSTKTKSDFLDKTYKFFLRKHAEDRGSDDEEIERYTPPEYQLKGLPPGDIIYANSRRRIKWPTSLPESLNWLVELCNFASTYTGAWVLTSTGVISDLMGAYTAYSQEYGQTQHIGETMLIILLITLCLRVKETQYKFVDHFMLYLNFLIDVLRQAMASQHFILKVNARYEFNGAAVDSLIPLIYGCFTQPYMPQFTRGEKVNGVVHVTIDLYEEDRVETYRQYRDHIEQCNTRINVLWSQLGRSHEKMDEHLSWALGHSPTVCNLVWHCLGELLSHHTIDKYISALSSKSLNILKTSLVKNLQSPGATPKAYLVAQELFNIRQLTVEDLQPCYKEMWMSLEQYLDTRLYSEVACPANLKLKALSMLVLFIAIPDIEPPSSTIAKLKAYCHLPMSREINSLVNLRIWHVVSKISPIVLDINDADNLSEDSPRFVQLAYQVLIENSRKRAATHNIDSHGASDDGSPMPEDD